jgi:hypothetical protein
VPREDARVPARQLARVQRDRGEHLLVDTDLDAPADQRRIEAVVVGVQAQMRVARNAHRPAARGVGHLVGQRRHRLPLIDQAIERPGTERLVRARVDLPKPGVELVLEVQLVREPPARLEVRLRVALQPLDRALGLRVARLAKPPVDAQLAAEAGEGLRRPPAMAVDARLAVPDQRPRQPAQPREAARDPASRSSVCREKISTPAPARE